MSDSVALGGERVAYTVYGDGPRIVVLLHGLLISQKMHRPLATSLAEAGNCAVTVDLLGHGHASRPHVTARYSVADFADQTLAVLDNLGADTAVIGGTSLGANVALEFAVRNPERTQGLVIEMPVLDNALLAAATVFTPMTMLLSAAPRLVRTLTAPARAIPEGRLPLYLDILCDMLRQDPIDAAHVLRGLLFGRTAPIQEERRGIAAPALVIGHRRDPVHPFSDAGMLAREMANARLVEASSLVELRLRPERLTREIATFIDGCWKPRTVRRRTA